MASDPKIRYKSGYKYQLHADYGLQIDILPEKNIVGEHYALTAYGELLIKKGYAWDGPSGPAIDTQNFMRGSLVHDALYQAIRGGKLHDSHRKRADWWLKHICIQDGMSALRAWWAYYAVRIFGGGASHNQREIITAP